MSGLLGFGLSGDGRLGISGVGDLAFLFGGSSGFVAASRLACSIAWLFRFQTTATATIITINRLTAPPSTAHGIIERGFVRMGRNGRFGRSRVPGSDFARNSSLPGDGSGDGAAFGFRIRASGIGRGIDSTTGTGIRIGSRHFKQRTTFPAPRSLTVRAVSHFGQAIRSAMV